MSMNIGAGEDLSRCGFGNSVLIVDDSAEQLGLTRTVLEDAGYSVFTAFNGSYGVSAARAIRPDVILSDVVMPGLDGFELCRLVRATPGLASTPVVLMSAVATDTDSAVTGFLAGADEYLEVPYDPVRLVLTVARLLERHRAEENLRRQRDSTLAIMTSLAESIIAFDRDGRVTFINPAAEKALGWSQAEVANRTIPDLLASGRAKESLDEGLDRSLAATLRFGADVRVDDGEFGRRDGSTVPVCYSCSPMRVSGEIAGGVLTFHDITDRVETERQLRLQERQLQEAQRLAQVGSWTWTVAADVTVWSDELFRITGRDPESGAPSYAQQRANLYGNNAEHLHSAVERTLATGEPFEAEVEIVRPDGQRRWIVTRGEAVRRPSGEIEALRGTVQDITARRLAHLRLEEQEEQLRLMTSAIDDVFWMRSPRLDRLLYVSPGYERLWGQSLASVYEQPASFLDVIHSDDHDRVVQVLTEHADSAFTCEYRLVHPDGSVRWVRDRGFPVRTTDGEVMMMTGVASDITELHEKRMMLEQANERLEASERRYRDLVENLSDVVFALGPDGLIEYVSAATETYGYDPSDLVGRPLGAVVHPEDLPAVERCLGQGTAGTVAPFELRVLDSEGRVRYTRVSCRLLLDEGCHGGITGVMIDVTEQRRAEEQLRAAQRLEAVGRLAGGIAHDFNNLLVAIIGYAEFAVGGLNKSDPLHSDLQEIITAGDRAEALTRQLLAFSRQQVLKPRVIDVNDVLYGMEAMLRRLIGEDIDFQTVYAAEPGLVLADPGQVEQVIMNLAVNARDAMPTGGSLRIQTTIEGHPPGSAANPESAEHVTISVTDTGCGIDDAIRAQIFEPFFSTKAPGEGTGLGLATVHGIVAQSGGEIAVESTVGVGTSFRVAFPRVVNSGQASVADVPASLVGGNETILLVEDEPVVRRVATRSLTAAGYTVLAASDSRHALLVCEEHEGPIDLLLTDVVMPGMSGRVLWEQVRELRPAMRVLYMSGYSGTAIAQHGVLDDGTHLIEKPFHGAALTRRVREALLPRP